MTDQIRNVRVRALSWDQTVAATITPAKGLRVRIEPGSLTGHKVYTLEQAVGAAITGAFHGYRRVEAIRCQPRSEALTVARDTSANRRLRSTIEAPAVQEVCAIGPRGVVRVRWHDLRFHVTFRDMALKLHERDLSIEIENAIAAMCGYR